MTVTQRVRGYLTVIMVLAPFLYARTKNCSVKGAPTLAELVCPCISQLYSQMRLPFNCEPTDWHRSSFFNPPTISGRCRRNVALEVIQMKYVPILNFLKSRPLKTVQDMIHVLVILTYQYHGLWCQWHVLVLVCLWESFSGYFSLFYAREWHRIYGHDCPYT